MKIQSRPPEDVKPKFNEAAMTCSLRNIMEIHGSGAGTSDTYRRVLAEGACGLFMDMGVITDFQIFRAHHGYYGLAIDVRLPDGETTSLVI